MNEEMRLRILEISAKVCTNLSKVSSNVYLTIEEDKAIYEVLRLSKELYQMTQKE